MNDTRLNFYKDILSFDDARSDIVLPRKDLDFYDDDDTFNIYPKGFLFDYRYTITEFALGQLCTALEIPHSYIHKCPPFLKKINLYYWNQKCTGRPIVRLCLHKVSFDSKIIGVVSNKYTPYSYKSFVDDFIEVINSIDIELSHPYNIGMEALDMNVMIKDMSLNDNYGEGNGNLIIGLHARNSEVGHDSANVSPIVYNTRNNSIISLSPFMLNYSKVSVIHVSKEKRISDKFSSSFSVMFDYLKENYTRILDIVRTSGNYSISIKDIRVMIKDNSLPQDIIDNELNIILFDKDTPPEQMVNFRSVIDAIAVAASKRSYPARWEIEKIAGKVLSEYEGIYL